MNEQPPKVAVIGGGIAGLVAAYELSKCELDFALYEASTRVGGKLLTTAFAGLMLDEGADAFITRVPYAKDLCDELGLADTLVSPATSTAYIFNGSQLKSLPKKQILGVPLDTQDLRSSGLVSEAGCAAIQADLDRQVMPDMPETVGDLVRQRLGNEIAEKLTFPLIGSINAGNCDKLDLQTTAPLLYEAAKASPSLINGLLRQTGRATRASTPVFLSPQEGMAKIAETLEQRLQNRICLDAEISELRHVSDKIAVYRAAQEDALRDKATETLATADTVVIATPSWVTSKLLTAEFPEISEQLLQTEYASVAIVSLAYETAHTEATQTFDGSGFLVPDGTELSITACSWASSKWQHLSGDKTILRVSVGRHGNDSLASAPPEEFLVAVKADLKTTLGITQEPTEVRISRWPKSFPQYAPGHAQRTATIEKTLNEAGIFLAGAGYHGIGVPACIASGRRAAQQAVAFLA